MTHKKQEEKIEEQEVVENNVSQDNWNNEIETLKQEIANLKESLARSQADYSNLIRRTEKEKDEARVYITSKVVGKILPFIDNLERAIESIPEDLKDNSWINWITGIYNSVVKQLESLEIKPYNSIGEEFNLDLHEVITQWPWKENTVIMEIEKWYKLWDKVIRIAKVMVGNWQE